MLSETQKEALRVNLEKYARVAVLSDSQNSTSPGIPAEKQVIERLTKDVQGHFRLGGYVGITEMNLNSIEQYDVSFSGGFTYGTAGPMGCSLKITPGNSITWTDKPGAANTVDLVYNQNPGGGTVRVDITLPSGSTGLVSSAPTAGAPGEVWLPGPVLTNVACARYTISAVGGMAEVTAIYPRNFLGRRRTPEFIRLAHSGRGIRDWTTVPSTMVSVGNHLKQGGGRSLALFCLHRNDLIPSSCNASSAVISAAFNTFISSLQALGDIDVGVIFTSRFGEQYPIVSGEPFEAYLDGAVSMCRALGVPMLNLGVVQNLYPYPDSLHWSPEGHAEVYEEKVAPWLTRIYQ